MSFTRHQAVGAYQRWEPPAFDEQADAPAAPADNAADAAPVHAPAPVEPDATEETQGPAIQLPTAEEIETMFEDARREGFAAGFVDGAEAARQQVARLAELTDTLDASLARLDGEIAEEVVALAIELARRMVRRTLAEQPAAINEVVREAMQQLPQSRITIHVNPDDAALVREFLAEQGAHQPARLVEDEGVARGGCRLQSENSEIDATLETRWRRILEGIGRANDTRWDAEPS